MSLLQKKQTKYLKIMAITAIWLSAGPWVSAKPISLELKHFKVISFNGIPPTQYKSKKINNLLAKEVILEAKVAASASALILPFDQVCPLKSLSFFWQTEGQLNIKDARWHHQKEGDDYYLRIGLLIFGPKPLIPFFAPQWIKTMGKISKLPSNRLIYLVVGPEFHKLTPFENPYSNSIQMQPLKSMPSTQWPGWWQARYTGSVQVTGLWIMADGDNTQSHFTSRLRQLSINCQ